MNRWLIALVVAAATSGGFLGWTLRGEPPKPEVRIVEKKTVEYRDRIVREEATNTMQVLPPKVITRTITRYVTAEGECKEEIKEREEAGPGGTIATDTKAKATTDSTGRMQQEAQQVETHPEPAPRFTLGLGVAMSPLADERKLAPAVSLGGRVYENYTLRVAADVPATAPKETRVSLLLELPL